MPSATVTITMMNLFVAAERVRRQFILTSALCGLVVVSLIALMIWHSTFQNKKRASKLARFERITLKSVSGRASKGRLKG